jgi:flagellar biosynthesis/type III secretory pathway chaperone
MLGEETGLRYEKEDPELMMSDLPLEEQTKFREKLKYLGDLVLELNELVKINSRLLENSIELLHKYVEFLKKNPHITSILLENRG